MKKIFAAVFGLIIFFCATCQAYTAEGYLKISMLNVGQGDAFLIETYEQNILIDTGDVDSKKLITELKRAKVTRLERIILTHAHADHIGGVLAVLKNFPVDEISDNGIASSSPIYRKYRKADVKFSALKAGDLIYFGDGIIFQVFSPPNNFVDTNVNNQSIAGKLIYDDFSMLFTGDAEKSVEKDLIGRGIRATVLKAPHHGSKTSSTKKFIEDVAPIYVLISAGKENKFGHPHEKTIKTYLDCMIEPQNIFCTAYNGTVVIETDGERIQIKPQKRCAWIEN